jgi:hypothetical protein
MKLLYSLLIIALFASCEKDLFVDKNNDPEYIFDTFWHELDRNYSFFTYTRLNWDSVYSVYKPKVTANTSKESLFQIFTNITDLVHDAHTNVYTPMGVTGNINYFDQYPVNQITLMDNYFEYYNAGRIFEYGKIKSANIGYIKIKTFDGNNNSFEQIDTILANMKKTDGLIIDVRSNRGGKISNSQIVAGRFADSLRIACKYRVRNGPQHNDFTAWFNVYVSPSKNQIYQHKPIAVLTNRMSYSATEWFVLFADVLPNVTIVGDTTGGGSAMPIVRELSNGWLLRTSNSQTLTPSGRDFQFTGLYPDVPIWIKPEDSFKEVDTIFEKAILVLLNF